MTNLNIAVSTTTLNAETNNSVTLSIYNDFVTIYDLSVSMSFTTSTQGSSTPTIIGLHSWTFTKVAIGDTVDIPIVIFTPEDTAGNAYTANVVLTYKRLGYTSSITEDDTIGFYVQKEEEWIDLIFYDIEVNPHPALPGSSISFSANILNKGNIPAMYVNVSLVESDVLLLLPESYNYLGQIDPNSPTTFDLEASLKPQVKEGSSTVEMQINYEDEDNTPFSISHYISFNIAEPENMRQTQEGPFESILGPLRELFFSSPSSSRPVSPDSQGSLQRPAPFLSFIPFFILIVIIISIVAVYVRRRRSKKNEFEEALEEE